LDCQNGEHDDFADELKREWFGQRAGQIHKELIYDLDRYATEIGLVERRKSLPGIATRRRPTSRRLRRRTISTAQGVLAAITNASRDRDIVVAHSRSEVGQRGTLGSCFPTSGGG